MADQPRVLISYAHQDGEAFANALRRRLEHEQPEITLWQDHAQIEGGIGWWRQITEALDNVDFLVLILTPVAVHSPVVRQEWRYARHRGVCVYPVILATKTEFDYRSLPKWMRKVHFFDLEREWNTFVNYLKSPCLVARVSFMAPDLPRGYVERPALTERLLGMLMDQSYDHSAAINIALYGAGGLGKSTLAAALCHKEDIIGSFDDGILWVTLGQNPNIQDNLTKLYAALSGLRPGFVDKDDVAFHHSEKLEDKNCLIVIDDVWDPAHLEPFMQGGRSCSRVITTRNFEIAAETSRVEIDQMSTAEAVKMLTSRFSAAPVELEPFKELAKRLSYWPLLLELANAALRRRVERGDTIENAFQYLNRKLDEQGVAAFDQRNASARNYALTRTIDISLNQLQYEELQRFTSLAIFPANIGVPIEQAANLWGCNDFEAEDIIQRLDSISLVKLNFNTGRFRLHDVMRGVIGKGLPDPVSLNNLTSGGQRRAHQGHTKRLRAIVSNEDGNMVVSMADDRKLKVWEPGTRGEIRSFTGYGYWPLAISPNGRHIVCVSPRRFASLQVISCETWTVHQVLKGHTDILRAVVIMPNSLTAVSAADDCTIRSWDILSGRCLVSIPTQKDYVRTLAALPDGRSVISGSYNGSIQVWDLNAGCEVRRFSGHTARINAVAASPNGKIFISAAGDNTLKLWNLATGAEEILVDAHEDQVNGVLVDKDGKFVVSYSDDCTVKLWRLIDLKWIATFTGDSPMKACTLGEQGLIIAGDRSGCMHFVHIEEAK